jgi:hypothetical protein
VDPHRERLRDLSHRLVRLHKLLLDRERRRHENLHGAIPPRELLHLLIADPRFAWLRSLSAMIASIDELVDADGAIGDDHLRAAFRDTYRLLKSEEGGEFQARYHEAFQDSPEIVMAHADVSKVLRPDGGAAGL